jgi:hypothetical protein
MTVRTLRLTWIAVGLVAFASACGPAPTAPPAAKPSPGPLDGWNVGLIQTGGLAGVDLEVQVSNGGQLLAANRRSGHTANAQLTKTQLDDLGRLYEAADAAQYAQGSSTCADCFQYELALTSGDTGRTIKLDDTSLTGTAAEPLVAYLTRLRDDALASP